LTYAILLLVVGILLVFLEAILPSGGILSVLAIVSLLAAVILGFISSVSMGLVILFIIFISVPVLVLLGVKLLPKIPFGRRMILVEHQEEFDEARGEPGISDEDFSHLRDKGGITVTELRPSGIAEIGGKRYSVVSQGGMLEASVEIIVKEVEGNNIVVTKKSNL
jgi:membrane-bound serine protease (ClpP class)